MSVQRPLSSDQQLALEDPATMLATIWRITRTDGAVLRLTDHDVAVVADGQTYLPNGSTQRTSISFTDGLGVDNLDIKGVIASGQITEDDVQNGRYDYAALVISLAFANLALPPIPLATGRFGEIELDNGGYTVQINGLTQALQTTIGELTTPTCRASLGDSRCRAVMTTWRHTYTLASVTDGRTLLLTGPSLLTGGATYAGGLVEVLTGAAAGLAMEVRSIAGLALTLYLPLPVLPTAGDTVRVTAGCDKSRETCKTVFSNVINFQGEPDVPGIDALLAPGVD